MEDFIKRHKAVAVASLLVAFIGLAFLVVSSFTAPKSPPEPNPEDYSDIDEAPIPYGNSLYSIDFNENQVEGVPSSNNIKITAYAGYRSAAINEMYDIGLNPTDYKITFNFESPFKKYE